jgi:hypothetical protein
MRKFVPIVIAAGILSAASLAGAVQAQQLAPGPAMPGNTGGSGPGSTAVAPGGAQGGMIRQEGPGDVPLSLQHTSPTQPTVGHASTGHPSTSHRTQ